MASFDRLTRRLEVRSRPLVAVVAGVVFLISVFAALGTGSTTSSSSPGPTTTTTAPPGLEGFSSVAITVTAPDGSKTEKCALLAETQAQLAKGLMGQQDIGGYPAMVFRFAEETQAAFYTANVPKALSIAWFDGAGKFVSAADMPPCETLPEKCARYSAKAPFRFAIETMQGGLGALGLVEGSIVTIGGSPCGFAQT